jgi:hypothetical protein
MTGDYYRSVGYANIDRAEGGSWNGMLEGFGVTLGLTGPNTKVIPGHGHTELLLSSRTSGMTGEIELTPDLEPRFWRTFLTTAS